MKLESLGDIADLHPAALMAGAVPLVLLLGFLVLAAFGKRMGGGGWLGVLIAGFAFVGGAGAFLSLPDNTYGDFFLPYRVNWNWFAVGGNAISIGFELDSYSILMLLLVTFITLLVHIFSLAYIEKDPMRHRYWAYLSLFSAAMCGLVLADNLLLMFVCWELVGVASWFLIGFWFQQKVPANASYKAFIVNRIADAGFIVALMLIWAKFGAFRMPDMWANTGGSHPYDFWIGLGLLVAAIGKSAQFPFQIWLPDAMAGPTPVSSLIHAATMVAAGVYLLIRTAAFFTYELKLVMALLGAFTALIAAVSALTQTDIKRLLAYSTISQLGLMVMAIGVGGATSAFLHLWAHAFFKCGLFLVAGAVIHSLHKTQEKEGIHFDAQDMRFMGGLRRKLPLVFCAWLFFASSLAGLPLFSGFLTKDGILLNAILFAQNGSSWYWVVPMAALVSSFLTAFYIARQGMLVFFGNHRAQGVGAKPSFFSSIPKTDWRMLVPLCILAIGSTWLVLFQLNPFHLDIDLATHAAPSILPIAFVGLSVVGIAVAVLIYRKGPLPSRANPLFFDLSFRHFFLDEILQGLVTFIFGTLSDFLALWDKYIVDGLVRLVAGLVLRKGHRPSLSTATEWTDVHILDAAVNEAIQPQEKHSISRASAWLDQKVIDRFVTGFAGTVMRLGKRAGQLQSGKLQLYILYTMLGLMLLLLALIYIFTA